MSIVDIPKKAPSQPHRSFWPRRVWPVLAYASAPRSILVGALAAGAVGAFVLGDTGIGYPIVAVTILVVAFRASSAAPTRWQWLGALGIVLLCAVATFRAAEWLVALSVVLAVVVAGVVLSKSWTWTGIALGAVLAALVPTRMLGWSARGSRRVKVRGFRPGRVVLVVATTMILVVVFGSLFAAADPHFASILERLTPQLRTDVAFQRLIVFVLVAAGALSASYVMVNPPRFDTLARPAKASLRLWEWMVPLSALVVVFGTFVFVQLRTLFGGQAHVVKTDGLTNAEYARQGFWQLLVVTALTLVVLAVTIRKAPRTSATDRRALRVLLGVLCALSLVIVVSALHRMSLYERQYGYTTLRLFVTSVELLLGSVFVLLMATGVRMSGRWLPRAVGVAVVLTVLTLAVIGPDAYIARQNVDRFERTGKIDTSYLARLSADATPELNRLPEPYRSCAIGRVGEGTRSWTAWNLSESRARSILAEQPQRSCAYHAVR